MCTAAAATEDFEIQDITGHFNLSLLKTFNMYFLTKYVIVTIPAQINFCMEVGLLPTTRTCTYCKKRLNLTAEKRPDHATPVVYRCYNSKCKHYNKYISVRDRTVFAESKLSIDTILRLMVLYVNRITSYEQLRTECVDESGKELSTETISDWLTYLREVQLEALVEITKDKIGGPNCTVEIDESKFGKRKYNKGRVIEGQWVIGGICRENGDIFVALCPENKRDAETLMTIIENHVDNRSTVITDCWKAYDHLEQKKWHHLTVNHSTNFIDPSTGAHTQNIENTWWQMKRNLPSTHGGNLMLHFAQYLWQRKFVTKGQQPHLTFLSHVKKLYPGRK